MKILLLSLLLIQSAQAFRLNTNISAAFGGSEVKIFITSNSTCTNAGISNSEILDIAMEGAREYWNKVPTSSLRIKNGGIYQTTDSKFLTEKLCAVDSESTCDSTATVPIVNDIIIACNSDKTTNFPTGDYLAISAPTNLSGSTIKGSIILINDSDNTRFATLSRSEKVSVLAHEIGHAVGLGHSNKTEALMYYKNAENMSLLSQDDIDGISYLYPNKLNGCTGLLGGTIKFSDSDNYTNKRNLFPLSMLFGLSIGFLLLIFAKIFTRQTTKYGLSSQT